MKPGGTAAPSSLLLIKPGSLGDVVHALPCAAAIRAAWPDVRLTWLVDDRWASLLEENPCVSDTVVFPRQKFRGAIGWLKAVPWMFDLKKIQPVIALDLQGLMRSALMAKLSGAERIHGLSDAREGSRHFYTSTTRIDANAHAVTRYLAALPSMGIPIPDDPEFPLPSGTRPTAMPETGPYILLHPFARGSGKSLTSSHVIEFAKALESHTVVVAGQGMLEGEVPSNVINLLNRTTLREFIWLAAHASYIVSVDSGPMHIASALTSKLLSIHTWSDPRKVGPYNESAWVWQGGDIYRQDLGRRMLGPKRVPDTSEVASIAKWVAGRIN